MEIDPSILTEAIGALLGITVTLQSEIPDSYGDKLDVTSLPTRVLLGLKEFDQSPVSYVTSLLKRFIIGDQSQTAQETPKKKSSSDIKNVDLIEDDYYIIHDDFLEQEIDFDFDFDFDCTPASQKNAKKESANTSLRKELFVIPDEFFDPVYDFDFTHMTESDSDSECLRGDERYKRPYGWNRFALKVRNKYPDGNAWLGTGGWRNNSVSGEWPVSYHGTNLEGAEGIIKGHYKSGDGNAYGRGIYSSPDINVAELYAKEFTSKKNGKTYKVIMQNRVHPEKRTIINGINYWLVPIPAGTSAAKEKEIVESAIRPYGLLLKEV